MKRKFSIALSALFFIFLLIQLVPYGRNHTNPTIIKEPIWDSPETRAMVKNACFDCHSHETEWPWYTHIAPTSWLTQNHVEEGRSHLNFSDWGKSDHETIKDIEKVVESGEMPLPPYTLLHPEANLTDAERVALIEALSKTIDQTPESDNDGHSHSHDHDH